MTDSKHTSTHTHESTRYPGSTFKLVNAREKGREEKLQIEMADC